MRGWNITEVQNNGGWEKYLNRVEGWVPGEKTVFIFDDAQGTYEDLNLWSTFFKNITPFDDEFVIAFASYGSPTYPPSKQVHHSLSTTYRESRYALLITVMVWVPLDSFFPKRSSMTWFV